MKLIRLKIKNFRGIRGEENIIEFKDSNIIFLIGKNNVGKSTFLHAYNFFLNSKQKASKEDFFNHDPTNKIEIIGLFLKEEQDDEHTDFIKKEPDWVDKWVDCNGIVKIKKEWDEVGGGFKKYTYKPDEQKFVSNGFGGFDSLFSKYAPTPIFINAIESEESFEKKVNEIIDKEFLKQINNLFGEEYQKATIAIHELQQKITNAESVEVYNDRINKNFREIFPKLSLKITQKKEENIDIVKAFKTNHSIAVEKDGINRKETFQQHGHGIIRQALFNFLAFLKNESKSSQKDYIILFEEPELFLHPKSISLLRENLYSLAEDDSPFQIMCATHSAGMIDIAKPHSSLVRVVKNHETEETTVFQVGHSLFQSEDNKDFVKMINQFNPHVCETFYCDNVVLVEGDTEALVFRYLLKERYPNADVFVLNTGSKNNIPFFQEVLRHFQIKQIIIHDSDTRFVYKDGIRVKKKDGSDRNNPAWELNKKIWEEIEAANQMKAGMSKRHVSIYNFETANNYEYDKKKGKPLSAYQFAKELHASNEITLNEQIKFIVGELSPEPIISQKKLEMLVKEPAGK